MINKNSTKPTWLTGQFLVAMPGMTDPRFANTVIFLCNHSPEGAMGLIVNKLFENLDFRTLLSQLDISCRGDVTKHAVHYGGPVETGRGFILHKATDAHDGSVMVDDHYALTATLEVVEALAIGEGPSPCLVALGYAGWDAGQLERELQHNGWLTVPADDALLFDAELETKWHRAMAKLGIRPELLSADIGRA